MAGFPKNGSELEPKSGTALVSMLVMLVITGDRFDITFCHDCTVTFLALVVVIMVEIDVFAVVV